MKRKYTGKENFSQGIISIPSNNKELVKKQIRYIRSYIFNGGIYPVALKITSRENLIFLLNFLKLRKDILNILKELKTLKEKYSLKLYSQEFELVDKNIYYIKLKELKDYRQVYNSLIYKYNYILKSL